VKKMAKSQFSKLGTVGDGVKKKTLTVSRVICMTAQYKREGVTSRASRVKDVTA
jgi:hypothetical protein